MVPLGVGVPLGVPLGVGVEEEEASKVSIVCASEAALAVGSEEVVLMEEAEAVAVAVKTSLAATVHTKSHRRENIIGKVY